MPVAVVTDQLVRDGVKVLKNFQEKDKETGLATNVWNILVEVDNADKVPDRMRWTFAGLTGNVLVNMVGRPPKCLRCHQRGHTKFDCQAPYCYTCRAVGHEESDTCPSRSYAALVRGSEPTTEVDMDDPVEARDVAVDDQTTDRQSWADQMDQHDQTAATAHVEHPAAADPPAETTRQPAAEPATTSAATAESTAESASDTEPEMAETSGGGAAGADGGWTVKKSRKRTSSTSPSRRSGKSACTPTDATEGRRPTKPRMLAPRSSSASKAPPREAK